MTDLSAETSAEALQNGSPAPKQKPTWDQVFTAKSPRGLVVIVKKLSIRKPVFSYSIGAVIEEKTVPFIRPEVAIGDDGIVSITDVGRDAADLVRQAQEYIKKATQESEDAFRAFQAKGGKPGKDPAKELAKRQRRERNLAERRAKDASFRSAQRGK